MTITDPRDIPGLVAWYSAEAETGYADNADTSGWTDLSGMGNDATPAGSLPPKWRSSLGASGGPAMQFNGSGYFALPNIMSGATAGEIAVTVKANSAAQDSGLLAFGQKGSGGDDEKYPFSDGNIYEPFGLAVGQRKSFTPSLSVASWRRYNVWSAASDWGARLDGTTQLTSTTATVTWPTAPRIGAADSGGVYARFFGLVGCVVLYNRKLNTTERDDLDAWLAANPSGGGTAPSAAATVRYYDGANLQPAAVAGWYDGSAVQPGAVEGWWDGTQVQPLA